MAPWPLLASTGDITIADIARSDGERYEATRNGRLPRRNLIVRRRRSGKRDDFRDTNTYERIYQMPLALR